jgi:hypothetical protein
MVDEEQSLDEDPATPRLGWWSELVREAVRRDEVQPRVSTAAGRGTHGARRRLPSAPRRAAPRAKPEDEDPWWWPFLLGALWLVVAVGVLWVLVQSFG